MIDELYKYESWINIKLNTSITDDILIYHTQKVLYFQHERLIHLLVTLTIGLALLISVLVTLIIKQPVLLIIDGLLLILFIPYLFHYRGLENGVQRLYKITDRLYKAAEKID